MTKEQAIEKLKARGYALAEDTAIVTVLIDADGDYKAAIKDVTNVLVGLGYESSFGVKMQETTGQSKIRPQDDKSEAKADKSEAQEESDDEFFDEEDTDMLLEKDSVQFSLEDFGLDF